MKNNLDEEHTEQEVDIHQVQSQEGLHEISSQIIKDRIATAWFLAYVLPQFLEEKPDVALRLGVSGISTWLASSDTETREHFLHVI